MDLENTNETQHNTSSSEASDASSFSEAAERAYDEMSTQSADSEAAAPKADSRQDADSAATEDAPFTWDSIDPRAKSEYETISKRYKDTQAYLTKKSQEWKSRELEFQKYQQAQKHLDYFNEIYSKNPEVQSVINKALGLESNIDPDLQQDPLFKYIQGYKSELENQITPVVKWVQEQQNSQRERALDEQVDAATNAASSAIKDLLGRDATPEEMSRVLKYMVEKRNYDGDSAAKAVFFQDIMNAKIQAALSDQMKKKTIGSRVSTVNSGKARSKSEYDSMSMKDIVASALENIDA